MTAFQAIPGSSDSLRPPSRTEPYTNFRDTTQRVQEAYEEALAHACGEGVSSEALDIDGGDSARQAAHPVVQADTRSREPFGSDSAPDSTERPPLHGSLPASDEVSSYVAEERCSRERTDADAVAWLESRAAMARENIAASSERALLEHREQNDAFICQELARQYGREFTIDSSALDAAFSPMGDARGRAACTAVASDGTVYTALVEYGTDGAVTELVMAEAA